MGVTRNDEIRMMGDPMLWPNIYLPVKRYPADPGGGKRLETGILAGSKPRVYTVNMYMLSQYEGKKWEEIPHIDYASHEAMVDDGWQVDRAPHRAHVKGGPDGAFSLTTEPEEGDMRDEP